MSGFETNNAAEFLNVSRRFVDYIKSHTKECDPARFDYEVDRIGKYKLSYPNQIIPSDLVELSGCDFSITPDFFEEHTQVIAISGGGCDRLYVTLSENDFTQIDYSNGGYAPIELSTVSSLIDNLERAEAEGYLAEVTEE